MRCVFRSDGIVGHFELVQQSTDMRNVNPPANVHELMFRDFFALVFYLGSEAERKVSSSALHCPHCAINVEDWTTALPE